MEYARAQQQIIRLIAMHHDRCELSERHGAGLLGTREMRTGEPTEQGSGKKMAHRSFASDLKATAPQTRSVSGRTMRLSTQRRRVIGDAHVGGQFGALGPLLLLRIARGRRERNPALRESRPKLLEAGFVFQLIRVLHYLQHASLQAIDRRRSVRRSTDIRGDVFL